MSKFKANLKLRTAQVLTFPAADAHFFVKSTGDVSDSVLKGIGKGLNYGFSKAGDGIKWVFDKSADGIAEGEAFAIHKLIGVARSASIEDRNNETAELQERFKKAPGIVASIMSKPFKRSSKKKSNFTKATEVTESEMINNQIVGA